VTVVHSHTSRRSCRCVMKHKGTWLLAAIPSSCVTKSPRSTQPGHPSVGRRSEYQPNRHTARCTIAISVVSQCKPVSGWGLRKRRSAGRTRCVCDVSVDDSDVTGGNVNKQTLMRYRMSWCINDPSYDRGYSMMAKLHIHRLTVMIAAAVLTYDETMRGATARRLVMSITVSL